MAVRWTDSARRDLERLVGFLEAVDVAAADRAIQVVFRGVKQMTRLPRIGRRLPQFDPREVRRIIVGDYELRYEVRDSDLVVLRLGHVHEDR